MEITSSEIQILLSHKPRTKCHNEAEFTTSRGRRLTDRGAFYKKIPDTDYNYRPFDAIIAIDGYVCAVELKATKNKSCKIYGQLRAHQHGYLELFEKNGGIAVVGVFSILLQTSVFMLYKDITEDTKIVFSS